MRRTFMCLALLFGLSGCAANLQRAPTLVGTHEGKSLYSIDGYTDWGETREADARAYAEKFSKLHCKADANIVRFESGELSTNGGIRFRQWMAAYTCDRPN
ncbi:hypothetical protein [Azospirillum sp.]|uniref:hypothetical protein n=1 Tax=Azospirillum sp. TaxID=34012 RepID=UPI002D663BFB|nr:hypothetical protein [Azospirillum sp.]HYD64288.1 hypothetical protein [Azospirillum sp.]